VRGYVFSGKGESDGKKYIFKTNKTFKIILKYEKTSFRVNDYKGSPPGKV